MDKRPVPNEWNELFGKHFCLKKKTDEALEDQVKDVRQPSALEMFVFKVMQQMGEMKDELNYTKSLLNDYDIVVWQSHTNFTNICSNLAWECKRKLNAELCTKAWLKFCTIINTFDVIKQQNEKCGEQGLTSVHLCEAPGAFVTCLNHHLVTKFPHIKWNWMATTLNPYYDGNCTTAMIDDDRFMKNTLSNWNFGADFTGDIMSIKNLENLKEHCREYEDVLLVTADGSIACFEDPCKQESLVAPLLYWEFITAINIMSNGACFVVKAFTILEEFTISLIYLLSCAFSEVHFTKPGPSKPGNSEVYIVCKGFFGLETLGEDYFKTVMQRTKVPDFVTPLVPLRDIPETFLSHLVECEEFFIRCQIFTIHSNIDSFKNISKKKRTILNEVKGKICQQFIDNFDLKRIDSKNHVYCKELTRNRKLSSRYTKEHRHNFVTGNFYERIEKNKAAWIERAKSDDFEDTVTETGILWFSNKLHDITDAEVSGLSPVLGRKFEIPRTTQFCLNSAMKNLLDARESVMTCKKDKSVAMENSKQGDSLDASVFKELDTILGQSSSEESTVFKLEKHNIIVGEYASASVEHVVSSFNADYHCLRLENTSLMVDCDTPRTTSHETGNLTTIFEDCSCNFGKISNVGDAGSTRSATTRSPTTVDDCIIVQMVSALEAKMASNSNLQCSESLVFLSSTEESYKGHETSKWRMFVSLFMVMTRLKKGGSLVCEICDIFTNANAGMIYLFSRIFARIGIFKSVKDTQEPGRILICQDFHGIDGPLFGYVLKLLRIELDLIRDPLSDKEVIHILPVGCILEEEFLKYLKNANELHSKIQVDSLRRIYLKENEDEHMLQS